MIAMRLTRCCAAVLAVAAVTLLLPGPAQAYWRGGYGHGGGWHGGGWYGGGVWFGLPPVYVAPPPVYYYPPPAYVPAYPPPQQYYRAPQESGPPALGQACYAGPWICQLERPTASGNSCSCSGPSGRTWGRAR